MYLKETRSNQRLEGLGYRVYSLEGNMLSVHSFHFEGGHILATWEYGRRAKR